MGHPPVIVLGYSEAAMFLRGDQGQRVGAVVSIYGQREHPVETKLPHHLVLNFDDVDVPVSDDWFGGSRQRLRQRKMRTIGLDPTPPQRSDAEAIVRFAESIREIDGALLCQCHAGISRSAAAALICLAVWRGRGHEAACTEELTRVRKAASPHLGLVHFADEILGRGGALVGQL